MANILDDLKGILGEAEFAKIEANAALKARISRGEEFRIWYDGDGEGAAEPPAPGSNQNEPPPARREPPAGIGAFDLSAVERMLDSKLSNVGKTIEDKIAETVQKRGDELVNTSVKIALQRADELNRIYARHNADFGEAFDSAAFNTYLEENKAKGFRTITEAYEAMTAQRRTDKEVERRVTEGVKAKSGEHVPGTTPPPSTNSNIRFFKQRSVASDGTHRTGAQKAAELLDRRAAEASA